MIIAKIFFAIFIVLGAFYWIVQLVCTLRLIASVRTVTKLPYKDLKKWPRVSVIIPARNEADTIKAAMRSRLESDYPNLEIILIDDRSTDNTPEIIEEIAQTDSRVKAIHIKELPKAWIGKLYAMHTGAKIASGAWLLFSDADVHIASGTLKRVISYCIPLRFWLIVCFRFSCAIFAWLAGPGKLKTRHLMQVQELVPSTLYAELPMCRCRVLKR